MPSPGGNLGGVGGTRAEFKPDRYRLMGEPAKDGVRLVELNGQEGWSTISVGNNALSALARMPNRRVPISTKPADGKGK